jgi:hypothetical protein
MTYSGVTSNVPGPRDTELYTMPRLTREQMRYLLALLETRLARLPMSRDETEAEVAERTARAIWRVEAQERDLQRGDGEENGIDHLHDYLGEICAEHDNHGLWRDWIAEMQ